MGGGVAGYQTHGLSKFLSGDAVPPRLQNIQALVPEATSSQRRGPEQRTTTSRKSILRFVQQLAEDRSSVAGVGLGEEVAARPLGQRVPVDQAPELSVVAGFDEVGELVPWLLEQGVRYFVHSEIKLARFGHSAHLEEAQERLGLYAQLRSIGREVATFEGYATSYRGYTVRVFELPSHPRPDTIDELASASLN